LIKITEEDISIDEMVKRAKSDDAGAIVTFLGSVRDDGIERLQIEAFSEAALAELQAIREEAIERFSLKSVQVVHRTGSLLVGESIVAIVCSAGHREEAFAGCRYIIEELKKRAPIWKKEIGEKGERWVDGHERIA
jgi:molybdopterin synthase catalytic subunit